MINDEKAKILVETLPYIEKYSGKTMVVKYGGSAMQNDKLKDSVMEDIILMSYVGINVVLVHGGGKEINKFLDKLNIKKEFINGLRYTDKDTMEVVKMVLIGKVNKDLVSKINSKGGNAIGICGIDGNMILCDELESEIDLGFVGKIKKVNTKVVNDCLKGGYISVIASVGVSEDGYAYNINADLAASAIAKELKAEKLILLTDVPGLLKEPCMDETIISEVKKEEIHTLFEDGTISGGMIPKINSCLDALENGVKRVHILDGRIKHSIIIELFTDAGIGTLIY